MNTTIQNPQVFQNEWWHLFLEETNYLTEPGLLKNSVPPQFFNEQDLTQIFQKIPSKQGFGEPGLRVFVGKGQRPKEFVEFFRNPMQVNETLQGFMSRLFNNAPFGVVLNRTTKFHPDLGRRLAPLYQGIVEKLGIDWIDLNATLFVGNYGYTPFGVHYDGEAKSVIHFHQGPGTKKMTLWNEDTFVEKTGSRLHYCHPEKILSDGTTYEIEAHDTFFLPEGPFHIGNTEDFSIALTVVIKGISVKDWLSNALAEIQAESFNPEILAGYDTDLEEVLQNGLIEPGLQNQSLNGWVAGAMEDYQLSIKSNCGFKPPRWSDEKTFPDLGQQSIQIVNPFQLYYKHLSDNHLRLYYRRNKQNFAQANVLIPLIEQLNTKEILEVGKVLAQHPSDKDFLLDFFTLLLNHQAIELA